jgi:hypothetical protein
LIPAKELITSMPEHVERPPADKFDVMLSSLFKTINIKKKQVKPK